MINNVRAPEGHARASQWGERKGWRRRQRIKLKPLSPFIAQELAVYAARAHLPWAELQMSVSSQPFMFRW